MARTKQKPVPKRAAPTPWWYQQRSCILCKKAFSVPPNYASQFARHETRHSHQKGMMRWEGIRLPADSELIDYFLNNNNNDDDDDDDDAEWEAIGEHDGWQEANERQAGDFSSSHQQIDVSTTDESSVVSEVESDLGSIVEDFSELVRLKDELIALFNDNIEKEFVESKLVEILNREQSY